MTEKVKVPNQPLLSPPRAILFSFALAAALVIGGCANSSSKSHWTGPAAAAPVNTAAWSYNNAPAKVLTTPHYEIHTTVIDPEAIEKLPQVMEGAYAQYQTFATAPETNR